MADIEDFIADYQFGHHIWTTIRNAPYIDWVSDNDRIMFSASSGVRAERYKRTPGNDYESPEKWVTSGTLPLVTNLSVSNDLDRLPMKETNVSGSATTNLGTRFWFEFKQSQIDRPDDLPRGETPPVGAAEANPIRIPAPEGFRDQIREYAQAHGGEISRVKGAVFEERFAEAGVDDGAYVGPDHMDFHVKVTGIEDRQTLRDVFGESVELMQRIVRSER